MNQNEVHLVTPFPGEPTEVFRTFSAAYLRFEECKKTFGACASMRTTVYQEDKLLPHRCNEFGPSGVVILTYAQRDAAKKKKANSNAP